MRQILSDPVPITRSLKMQIANRASGFLTILQHLKPYQGSARLRLQHTNISLVTINISACIILHELWLPDSASAEQTLWIKFSHRCPLSRASNAVTSAMNMEHAFCFPAAKEEDNIA